MIVRPPIGSHAFSVEVPPADLSCKRGIFGEGEEVGHHVLHKGVLVDDLLYMYMYSFMIHGRHTKFGREIEERNQG